MTIFIIYKYKMHKPSIQTDILEIQEITTSTNNRLDTDEKYTNDRNYFQDSNSTNNKDKPIRDYLSNSISHQQNYKPQERRVLLTPVRQDDHESMHQSQLLASQGHKIQSSKEISTYIEKSKSTESELDYRKMYYDLLKDSLKYEDTIKQLFEENRIHQEYIISLEDKSSRILDRCTSMANAFHRNLKNPIQTDILKEYKQQIDILSDEKENIKSILSLTRHQNLQNTIRIEEMQSRIISMQEQILLTQYSQNTNDDK